MTWKNLYFRQLLFSIAIIITPLLSFIHLLFSREVSQISLLGFEYFHGYESNQVFVWMILVELSYLLLFLFGYITIDKRIKYYLIPLLVYFLLSTVSILSEQYILSLVFSLPGVILIYIGVDLILILGQIDFFSKKNNNPQILFSSLISKRQIVKFSNWNNKVENIKAQSSFSDNPKQELCELYHLTKIAERESNLDKKEAIKEACKKREHAMLPLLLLLLVITLLPFLHVIIPTEMKSIRIFGRTYESFGFLNIETMVWYFARKVTVIIGLLICFFKCKSWVRFSFLPALSLYSYQFYEGFLDVKDFESFGNTNIFPTFLALIFLFVLIAQIVKLRVKILDNMDYLNSRFEEILNQLAKENELT